MLLFKSPRMSGVGYSESLKHLAPTESITRGLKGKAKRAIFHSLSYSPDLKTMCGKFAICLCWIFLSFLLDASLAFISNISTQNQHPNVTVAQDQDGTGWDSPFLQLGASLPSFSQPIRPYTLITNADDYHYMPKVRHRQPSRLLRLLGSSFDPFWMSVDHPFESPKGSQPTLTTFKEKFNLRVSPELRKASAKYQQKLEKEAAELDLSSLPSDAANSVRGWLVRSATCKLQHQWVDLGPTFWPRWLRQTDCEGPDGGQSCSFPSGMNCVRAQTTHIKILAWHCIEVRDGDDRSRKLRGENSDGSAQMGTGETRKRCLWRQVPYPVVTACMCSCK